MRWKQLALTFAFLGCLVRTTLSVPIDEFPGRRPAARGLEAGHPAEDVIKANRSKDGGDSVRTTELLPVESQDPLMHTEESGTSQQEKGNEQKQVDAPGKLAQDVEGGKPLATSIIILLIALIVALVTVPLLLCFVCGCARCRASSSAATNDDSPNDTRASSVSDVTSASRGSGAVRLDVRGSTLSDAARRRFD